MNIHPRIVIPSVLLVLILSAEAAKADAAKPDAAKAEAMAAEAKTPRATNDDSISITDLIHCVRAELLKSEARLATEGGTHY